MTGRMLFTTCSDSETTSAPTGAMGASTTAVSGPAGVAAVSMLATKVADSMAAIPGLAEAGTGSGTMFMSTDADAGVDTDAGATAGAGESVFLEVPKRHRRELDITKLQSSTESVSNFRKQRLRNNLW